MCASAEAGGEGTDLTDATAADGLRWLMPRDVRSDNAGRRPPEMRRSCQPKAVGCGAGPDNLCLATDAFCSCDKRKLEKTMTKDPIFPEEELLNELMELYQESERPLTREQLIRGLLETDWDSDEVCVATGLYEEIIAKGIAAPRQIDAALDGYADAVAKGEARKMTHYEWLKTTFVDPTKLQ
jgi:hypothetical protein